MNVPLFKRYNGVGCWGHMWGVDSRQGEVAPAPVYYLLPHYVLMLGLNIHWAHVAAHIVWTLSGDQGLVSAGTRGQNIVVIFCVDIIQAI